MKESVTGFYLSKQRSELDWIRHAISSWDLMPHQSENDVLSRDAKALEAVKSCWVRGQESYFRKAAAKKKKQLDKLEATSKGIFWLAMLGVTPAMFLVHGLGFGVEALDQWLQVATPVAFAIAGAIKYYIDKVLVSAQIKQDVRMATLFDKALKLIDQAPLDSSQNREVLLKLGQEALAENGDWLLMHRERPIEVPEG